MDSLAFLSNFAVDSSTHRFIFIPIVNILVLVWSLVAGVVTLSETQRLSIGKAIGVYVVISVVLGILTLLLSLLFAASLFSGLAAGALASS